jgi:CRP/FNR family transcriptional regulator, cyclic AMP receptor protein
MVRRLRQTNFRFQLRHQPPAVKLVSTLVHLGEHYGARTPYGLEIFNIPFQDLADVSDITLDETAKIMDKLNSKGWIRMAPAQQSIYLVQMKQLVHLANR